MGMAVPIRMNMSQLRMTTSTGTNTGTGSYTGLLTLAQWLSPAYPVGAFAYSHGLETAIQSGRVATPQELQLWLSDLLHHGSGRNDCILLRAAYHSGDATTLAHVNATALAFAASAERRMETELQGDAFCQTTAAIWGGELSGLAYPVAVGAAAAQLNLDLTLTAGLYLQAFTSNLVSAAVRLVPLGQTAGQAVLAALTPDCTTIAMDTQRSTLDDLQGSVFLSDIAAMTHETLQPRIFRS
jgi:urease accessory protein